MTLIPAVIAGVDEAGRGCWAGPVVAAAVVINPKHPSHQALYHEVKDSKKLSAIQRLRLYHRMIESGSWIGVGVVESAIIDKINILQATLLAMTKALEALEEKIPSSFIIEEVQVDGLQVPTWQSRHPVQPKMCAIVGGDNIKPCISAASIIAKVTRDQLLIALDETYPHYGFAQHKGYGTKQHHMALQHYGPCPEHRFSYAPIRSLVKTNTANTGT